MREPLLTPHVERGVYRIIGAQVIKMGCKMVAPGGTEDHVHLLVCYSRLPGFGQFMNRIKGTTSHAINEHFHPDLEPGEPGGFRWQNGYGVFSVDHRSPDEAAEYIRNQKRHHLTGTLQSAWEDWATND